MTKKSIDGFVLRRSTSDIGEHHAGYNKVSSKSKDQISLKKVSRKDKSAAISTLSRSDQGLSRADIDESLKQIDDAADQKGNESKSRRWRSRSDKPKGKKRKIIRWLAIVVILVVLVFAGIFAVKTIMSGGAIFNGDIFGLIQQKELKMDANGRSNVLIFGTSEDDPGHDAAHLTDSMMVVSIDQKNKNAYMVSIPRDLYVEYDGKRCFEGSRGKINGYYGCLGDDYTSKEAEQEKLKEMQSFIGEILGMDIQYSVHINYSVVRELVNAVDGITVNIEGSEGAPGIMDANFDWKCRGGNEYASLATMKQNCPPNGHFIDYPNGPAKLDGEHALYLAQARGAGGTGTSYGLANSNFDREKNQQKILVALKEKALSTGTLTNFGRVTGLLDAIGNDNLRTNFSTDEIRTLMSLGDMSPEKIKSIDLYDSDNPVVKNGNIGGASVVMPVQGLYDYSGIQKLIRTTINATPVETEAANIVVLNGSGVSGAASTQADKLENLGMIIAQTDNAPTDDYAKTRIYKVGTKTKPNTEAKLKELYSVSELSGNPPISVAENIDFIVIVGSDAIASSDL